MTDGAKRVRKHREKMKAAGLKPVTIWVPDVNAPGYEKTLARDIAIINADADRMLIIERCFRVAKFKRLDMKRGDLVRSSCRATMESHVQQSSFNPMTFAHLHSVTVLPLTGDDSCLERCRVVIHRLPSNGLRELSQVMVDKCDYLAASKVSAVYRTIWPTMIWKPSDAPLPSSSALPENRLFRTLRNYRRRNPS